SRTWHGGHLFLLIGSLGDSGRTTFIFRELLSAVALRCERQGREAERRGRPPAPWPQSAIPPSTLRAERSAGRLRPEPPKRQARFLHRYNLVATTRVDGHGV